ncbi:hypothetical protein BIW11_08975, partial [Tropilaelaps mercedesae]
YQEALPKTIRSRKDPHLEYNELVDIMKWKLMRSKYKPAALDLVKTNTEKNVKATTQRAFKRMPKLDVALQALTAEGKSLVARTGLSFNRRRMYHHSGDASRAVKLV